MSTVPLRRLVDAEQWEAEDLAGRLGIVAHAAFLCTGFVPCGDEPSSGHLLKHVDEVGPSPPRLSRRYTAPQLARREQGGAAEVAVLELRARGDGGGVAFQAYLITRDGGGRRCLCQAVLDEAALAPLLPCSLDDAARALAAESEGAWLWRSLADWVSPAFLLELCRRNGLPVTGFASLPDDAVAEILKRLADGEELARVECTNRQLRRVVSERDGVLWKAVYESGGWGLLPGSLRSYEPVAGSWKERYVNARRRQPFLGLFRIRQHLLFGSDDEDEGLLRLAELRRERREALNVRSWYPEISLPVEHPREPAVFSWLSDWVYPPLYPPATEPAPATETVARSKNAGRQHRKLPRNDYRKKRHGAGAINSPSSRYRWNHR